MYLTPVQKELLDHRPRGIIRGPAGTGKTLLAIMKIKDITHNDAGAKILIIAPRVHALRVEKYLVSEGIPTTVSATFPPPPNSNQVIIIDLDDFFQRVTPETIKGYNIRGYNIFIDDLQALDLYGSKCTFQDVAEFVDRAYLAAAAAELHLWVSVDVGESRNVGVNDSIASLFFTNVITPRPLKIPVYYLSRVLRNSVEISAATLKLRTERISATGGQNTIYNSNLTPGHRITCDSIQYHFLETWTGDWEKSAPLFVAERVLGELTPLLIQNSPVKPQDIAIITDDKESANVIKQHVEQMLKTHFNIVRTQTIEDLITFRRYDVPIFDELQNTASFETPVAFYVRAVGRVRDCSPYNIMTRARTSLSVIDVNKRKEPPLPLTDDVVLTRWGESGGTYQRL